ncbi:MAG: (d)CMP kinase [Flavobacteriales bacterium]
MGRSRINIAIDGHSSAGKSTMAKSLAKELNYVYIDTGAMYRAATLHAMRERSVVDTVVNEVGLRAGLDRMFLAFRYNPQTEQSEIHLNGINVEKEIRTMEVASKVSLVARVPEVRTKLVAIQQRMAEAGGVVMDGRDIGTVVLPQAELKVFMTADPETRAYRRLNEMKENGKDVSYDEVLENVLERDRIDSERAVAPLRQAEDAVVVDNSDLTVEEQFNFLVSLARTRMEDDA